MSEEQTTEAREALRKIERELTSSVTHPLINFLTSELCQAGTELVRRSQYLQASSDVCKIAACNPDYLLAVQKKRLTEAGQFVNRIFNAYNAAIALGKPEISSAEWHELLDARK